MQDPRFPGAVAPERSRSFESLGVRLRLHEWGDPAAPPLLLTHGAFDHARGFDCLAPRLAARFRVIGLDARGHGDSGWADTYTWPVEVSEVLRVLRALGRPACLVGHSRGGGQAMDVAIPAPDLVRAVVNIDGFGPPPGGFPMPGEEAPDPRPLPERFAAFLDRRRKLTQRAEWRPYASLGDLVERRRAQNPRLSAEWLRYFVFHGAREGEDGWRWKTDPLFGAGFGPFKPDWVAPTWKLLGMPVLAINGSEPDIWTLSEDILAGRLAHVPRLERVTIAGAGHFVHMERPVETAGAVLDFLSAVA